MPSTDPWWTHSPPHSIPRPRVDHHPQPQHHQPYDRHELALGQALGEITAEGRRHTELLLGMQQLLEALPDRISDRLSELFPAAPPAPPPSPPPPPGPTRMQQVTELLKAMLPLALLAAIVMGKLTVLEGVSLIRHAIGAAP